MVQQEVQQVVQHELEMRVKQKKVARAEREAPTSWLTKPKRLSFPCLHSRLSG